MKKLSRVCPVCNKQFERKEYDILRTENKGSIPHCSLKCVRKSTQNSKSDKYSGFRKFIRSAKKRAIKKNFEFNINEEFLYKLFNKQKGICVYSNVKLHVQLVNESWYDPRYLASLDRINPKEGYTIDNVQFISSSMNYMKSTLTHKETIELLELIKNS